MYKKTFLSLFLAVCFSFEAGFAQASFSAKTDFTTGSYPNSISTGDLNGDGKKDMVVANSNAQFVSVFLNTTASGATTPSFSAKTDFATGTPYSVSIGDFNGDGMNDIAVANYDEGSVSVLLNTTAPGATTPSFSVKTDFATGTHPYSVSTGDFNGDGKRDIVVANYSSNTVSVFINTTDPGAATPTFSAKADFPTGNMPTSLSTGDFNGDGKSDIVVANYSSNTVSVFINTTDPGAATPTFSAKVDFSTGNMPTSVSTGDFNGDGKIDLAVTNVNSFTVSVFINTTATGAAIPAFSDKTDIVTGDYPQSVSLGDFNGDGKCDMAVANMSLNTVSVFLNTTIPGAAIPAFSAKIDFATGNSPYSISIEDFTGDNKNDMAVANYTGNSVSVLLNTTTMGVATPSFSTKTDFTTADNPVSVSVGDFNGDGKSDIVVASNDSIFVSVFLNTTVPGAATPTFSNKTDFTTEKYPISVSIGDFNGDGKNDMAVANYSSHTVSVLLNTTAPGAATPAFSDKTNFTTGYSPISVSIGDFNGDGKNDMAVANISSNTVSVLLNTTVPGATTASFSVKTDFTTGTGPRSVSIGDFNGDGKNDMAVANDNSVSISVLLNTTPPGSATPSFSTKTDFATGNFPQSVTIGDFNGDGKNDMAVANSVSDSVSVFLNTTTPGAATPSFSVRTNFATEDHPVFVSIGDFNGDGKNDLVVVNNNNYDVSVLLNTTVPGAATPSFSDRVNFATGNLPESVSIGDFNGDGKNDMAVVNYYSNNVSVLLNNADFPTSVEVTSFTAQIPETFSLAQNYPNPFNPATTIEFTVPKDGWTTLKIYNSLGQLVETLFDGEARAGYIQRATFDASTIASGVYFYRLEAGKNVQMKKLVFVK